MAFATVAAQASTTGSGANATPDISGLGIVDGSLVVIFLNYNGSSDFALPSGWTGQKFFTSGNMIGAYIWKICSSGESNPVFANLSGDWRTWQARIASHHVSESPQFAGTSVLFGNPNPPNLNPSWGSGEDTFWIVADLYDLASVTHTPPTNFTEIFDQGATRSIGIATRDLAADSLDPAEFTTSDTSNASVAITAAIRPVAAVEHTDAATVYIDLSPSGADVGPFADSAEIYLDLVASGVDEFPSHTVDAATIYVELTASGVDVRETLDSGTVYLDLQPSGIEYLQPLIPWWEPLPEGANKWFSLEGNKWVQTHQNRFTVNVRGRL